MFDTSMHIHVVGIMSREELFPIIREVWADIRSFTTDSWRLLSVTLGVFALVVSIMLITDSTQPLLFSITGWYVLLFLFTFTSLSLVAAGSLNYDITRSKKQVEKFLLPIFAQRKMVTKKPKEKKDIIFTEELVVDDEDMPVWLSKKHNIWFFYAIEAITVILWILQPLLMTPIDVYKLFLMYVCEILAITIVFFVVNKARKLDREEVYGLEHLHEFLEIPDID